MVVTWPALCRPRPRPEQGIRAAAGNERGMRGVLVEYESSFRAGAALRRASTFANRAPDSVLRPLPAELEGSARDRSRRERRAISRPFASARRRAPSYRRWSGDGAHLPRRPRASRSPAANGRISRPRWDRLPDALSSPTSLHHFPGQDSAPVTHSSPARRIGEHPGREPYAPRTGQHEARSVSAGEHHPHRVDAVRRGHRRVVLATPEHAQHRVVARQDLGP